MLNIIEIKYSNTPSKNRQHGINYCIDNNYEILIFGDSDDYFDKNRIDKSIELLKEFDIVVNDLSLFDENGIYESEYLSHRLDNLDVVDLAFIKDKNIFGLSNTAIRLENISQVLFDDEIIAVDWYFFKVLLKQGLKAVFTNEIVTYYRQYDNNIIGLRDEFPQYPIGFSDHSVGIEIPAAAVALGACLIEKHFTLDKSKIGMDNQVATEPDEMKKLVENCPNINVALGTHERVVLPAELDKRKDMRRSVVSARDLKAGHIIGLTDLDLKRPGTGIPADKISMIVGKTIKNNIEKDILISVENLK